jgi:mono/diheme cytochrome c family protein
MRVPVRRRTAVCFGLILSTGLLARAQNDPRVEAGRRIYEREKCAACHQIARKGNSRFPLDGVGSRLTPEQIRRWITHTAEMEAALPRLPAIRMSSTKYRLSKDDLDALVAYLDTLKKEFQGPKDQRSKGRGTGLTRTN